jgi:hypothetical protein
LDVETVFRPGGVSLPREQMRLIAGVIDRFLDDPTDDSWYDDHGVTLAYWIMWWASESPDVTIVICPFLADRAQGQGADAGLPATMGYGFGMTLYVIQHPEASPTSAEIQVAGIEGALRWYESSLGHGEGRNAFFDTLLQHRAAGTLGTWYAENVGSCVPLTGPPPSGAPPADGGPRASTGDQGSEPAEAPTAPELDSTAGSSGGPASGPAARPVDRDGDRVEDPQDRCPDDPEDLDSFEDRDGCPEPDDDQDGIADVFDACPRIPENRNGVEDEDGCPEAPARDEDADGLADSRDICPADPEDLDGFQDADGCPDIDNDGDGIRDIDDLCPNEPETRNGRQDQDGCPDR